MLEQNETLRHRGSVLARGENLLDNPERERNRWTMPYAATPLNSYGLREPDGRPYIHRALEYVDGLFDPELPDSPVRLREPVVDMLKIAIESALFSLVQENNEKLIPLDSDDEVAAIFSRACLGVATPDELMELLMRCPGTLESLELAKLTHPNDWQTDEMDVEIDDLMVARGFLTRGGDRTQNVRYSVLRYDEFEAPGAALFVRKADLGVGKVGKEGSVLLVQRDSFVIDLRHPDTVHLTKEITEWASRPNEETGLRGGRKIVGGKKIPYTGKKLTDFVNGQLATGTSDRSTALVPAVRSYYAHYRPTM